MAGINKTMVRRLAILLLDDEDGIAGKAWPTLMTALTDTGSTDIVTKVHAANGRFYLPEGHGFYLPSIAEVRES